MFDNCIISCGASKVKTAAPVMAWQLYTGQYFQTSLDLATRVAKNVYILSAGYGLLELNDMVAYYNHKMTPCQALEWRHNNVITLPPGTTCSLLGRVYSMALPELELVIPANTGRMAKRIVAMKRLIDLLPNRL